MRYERLNEHYILDTYTGMKLNQKKCIEQLNNYENTITLLREVKPCTPE